MTRHVEVLVIGAGPAGSSAAIRLARAGHEVLLVDRCRFPRPKPCGEFYNPAATGLLRELQVLDALRHAGAAPVHGLCLARPGKRGLVVPFAGLDPAGETALTLGREELDFALVREALRSGVEVWEETTCRAPLRRNDVVCGAVLRTEGREPEVRAEIVLAADGLRSRFARLLGLARPARPARPDGSRRKIGLSGRYRLSADLPLRVEMQPSTGGCCGLSVRRGEANLGMVVDASRAREIGGDPTAFFQREVERYPDLRAGICGPPERILTIGSFPWKTRRQSAGGCLLVGDAAGFYDPFTGQGVTFALLTAKLAAEVAGAALRERNVSAARLRAYDRRRKELLVPRVWLQQAIQQVIERPWLLDRTVCRLERHPLTARTLVGMIADVASPYCALSPGFLSGLVF